MLYAVSGAGADSASATYPPPTTVGALKLTNHVNCHSDIVLNKNEKIIILNTRWNYKRFITAYNGQIIHLTNADHRWYG